MKIAYRITLALALLSCFLFSLTYASRQQIKTLSTHPNAFNHYLTSGFSKKKILETASDHNGSLLFKRSKNTPDTIHIIAFRIEFNNGQPDTSPSTTGNGLFGIRGGGDTKEINYYNSGKVYIYDALPHDSAYFDNQFLYVRNYFTTVSHGKLFVDYSIYPPGPNKAYSLALPMTSYGPGDKRKEETYDQYNNRVFVKLLKFVRDAVKCADTSFDSPFKGLHADPIGSDNIFDSLGRRTVFCIVHAGSSYLTDGGIKGPDYRDSPFDMIDAFIAKDFLVAYKDTLKLDTSGIRVKGTGDSPLLIDEIMMAPETSNQDSLNFGIHGILVNQLARQIGIPDLYATSSGTTAIGAFCIMDFYGYSAGQGFIPPWPSAWVRAFMGWETPVVIPMGSAGRLNLKAVCLGNGESIDTTIALVSLNDHEYYLLENRQRSLVGGPNIFAYDTNSADNTIYIDPNFPLKLDNNVISNSSSSNCILTVENYDASLPASGIVVWHIDENVIRDRLFYDYLNADSSYRAVSLVEADGISDIGFEFQNGYYQLFFDYGGAEDVFPHRTVNEITPQGKDSTFTINAMGPWSKPSTHANDGGQTYLNISFDTLRAQGTEISNIRDYFVTNYVDSVFKLFVNWDYMVRGWPKRTVLDSGEKIFDPAVCDLYKNNTGTEIAAVSKNGRLYLWPAVSDSSQPLWFGDTIGIDSLANAVNSTMKNSPDTIAVNTVSFDTVHYFNLKNLNPRNPTRPFTFPTVINNKLFIPLLDSAVDIITSVSQSSPSLNGSIITLTTVPSTYVCKLEGNCWALGCSNGTIVFSDTGNNVWDFANTIALAADTPKAVCALAAMPHESGVFVCIQNNSVLTIASVITKTILAKRTIPHGISPYTVVTGDINRDNVNEIVVSDSRKGLWAFNRDLTPALGWENAPNDKASPYDSAHSDRHALALNLSPPALADIDGDGFLDIIAGGSNGIYALNYRGISNSGWPSYLDNRFFRGNLKCSPAIIAAPQGNKGPLVVFSSPSGENETFQIDKIVSADRKTGKIVFKHPDGGIDTTYGTASFIDSAVTTGDSLIETIVLYGGLVDAIDATGKRPLRTIGNNQLYSRWPLTIGAPSDASPLLDNLNNDGTIDLVAVASNGWVYRWKLDADMAGTTLFWKQTGFDGTRPFAYLAALPPIQASAKAPLSFYSWPNPAPDKSQTKGENVVNFKYSFSGPAKNVRLDIFTYTGYHVYSKTGLSGSYPSPNELSNISVANFGSGVYRCRMEAEVSGKKCVQYWKMAIVK